jgi:ATP-dependent helicase HrpB
VAERLVEAKLPPEVHIAPLYGALTSKEQDAAVSPAPPGARKVVLATSIAETSLTIEGVRIVIDCGLARVPRYDPSSGLTRLETVRVSRAAADQRRGRAGRTEPGVCYRLWDEPETRSLPAFNTPEIRETDLAGVALALAEWGARTPDGLALLDPPGAAAFSEARKLLHRLGALDAKGDLSPHGVQLGRLPLPPRLADMVVRGARCGRGEQAALLATIMTERGVGGSSTDITERVGRLKRDGSGRAKDALAMARRWAGSVKAQVDSPPLSDALLIAHAFPERIAQARTAESGDFRLSSGRGARVEPTDALARNQWLAVAELAGSGGASDRILLAASLDPDALTQAFADDLEHRELIQTDAAGRVRVRQQVRIGELVLRERLVERPDKALIGRALTERVLADGIANLPWSEGATSFRARLAFCTQVQPDEDWPDLSDEALTTSASEWLTPVLESAGSLGAIKPDQLFEALRNLCPWDIQRRLDHWAPARLDTPAGASAQIDYAAEGGPRVEVRVQMLFGLKQHPCVAQGRVPLTLALTSPAHRAIQLTKDLPGFWAGSWKDVKSEMKGRYPRHPWPDDPANAPPTTRAKPRGT